MLFLINYRLVARKINDEVIIFKNAFTPTLTVRMWHKVYNVTCWWWWQVVWFPSLSSLRLVPVSRLNCHLYFVIFKVLKYHWQYILINSETWYKRRYYFDINFYSLQVELFFFFDKRALIISWIHWKYWNNKYTHMNFLSLPKPRFEHEYL